MLIGGKKVRLDKYLCDCALGSRKDIKAFIREGRVSVNGKIAEKSDMQVFESDTVCFDENVLSHSDFIYIMLNKPQGYVSATEDRHFPTVTELIDKKYERFELFPVGRLDIDTTGLLILTNDGKCAHNLTSPRHHAKKVYLASVSGMVGEEDIKAFRDGIDIGEKKVLKSAELEVLESGAVSEVRLTISEGKFHQVKRMFEAVGKKVIRLERRSMAGVELDLSLKSGEYRLLTDDEIRKLKSVL